MNSHMNEDELIRCREKIATVDSFTVQERDFLTELVNAYLDARRLAAKIMLDLNNPEGGKH